MKNIVNYFLRGLLFVFPLVVTIYIIVALVQWSNSIFNALLFKWFGIDIPGAGIVIVFLGIALLGYLFSRAFVKPVIAYFDRFMAKVPLVKIIYTSLKDLTEAFVGDKKRFDKPVLADFSTAEGPSVKRIGFVTQTSLSNLGLEDMVAVYCPHSYNISGNLYLLPKHAVKPLSQPSSEVMKYVISGGVTKL